MAIRKVIETVADRSKFAILSLAEIAKRLKYLVVGILAFLLFLYFLTFFRDGSSYWQLLWSGIPFGDKLGVLGRVAHNIWENFTSLYGVSIILMSLFQGTIIMQLIFTWRNRERSHAIDGASTGVIAAIIGFITLGCPSCGVGLLTAIISAIAGTGAAALAESVGLVLIIIAFLLMIYTVVRLGYIDYIILSNQKVKEQHAKRS